MRLPWISREHHEAVLREKDRLIVELRAEIARMDKRAETPIAVTVKLPEDFAVQMPAVLRKRTKGDVKPEISRSQDEEPKWEECNENDPHEIARLAARELGGRKANAIVLAQTVARIKRNIVLAKINRATRQQEMGTLDARIPPTARVDNPEENIPADILARIAEAEKV